jgi:hypothetical protein
MYDLFFGDLRASPWGLLALALISHFAPETALTGAIYHITFGIESLTFCAIFATWIAPIFAILVLGRERQKIVYPPPFQTTPI